MRLYAPQRSVLTFTFNVPFRETENVSLREKREKSRSLSGIKKKVSGAFDIANHYARARLLHATRGLIRTRRRN